MDNPTWDPVARPSPGEGTVMPNKWVFTANVLADESLDKPKYLHTDGLDVGHAFALVIRISSLHVFYTFVAAMYLYLHHLDVVAAYLNAGIVAREKVVI